MVLLGENASITSGHPIYTNEHPIYTNGLWIRADKSIYPTVINHNQGNK
jgi:hypothetical protein